MERAFLTFSAYTAILKPSGSLIWLKGNFEAGVLLKILGGGGLKGPQAKNTNTRRQKHKMDLNGFMVESF